ncbi:MAG: OmpA family protein [Nitrospirota bacterium]
MMLTAALSIYLILTAVQVPFSEGCKTAVELYDKGTLSVDPGEKERNFIKAAPLCSDPEVLSRVYNNLADVYETEGEFSRALHYYRKAIGVKKDLSTPYISVGDIFYKLGDYYSSYVMYGKGLVYNPGLPEAIISRRSAQEGRDRKIVIYFDIDSFKLPDRYMPRLQHVIGVLSDDKNRRVEITGHTCDLGDAAYNRRLSERRAAAAKEYLKTHTALDDNKITVRGMGEDKPLLANKDRDSRTLNRRIEVIIKE